MLNGALTIWTIYDHPRDFPDVPFVIRMDVIAAGVACDSGERWLRKTIEEARQVIAANDPTADHRQDRHYDDDARIVEVWF